MSSRLKLEIFTLQYLTLNYELKSVVDEKERELLSFRRNLYPEIIRIINEKISSIDNYMFNNYIFNSFEISAQFYDGSEKIPQNLKNGINMINYNNKEVCKIIDDHINILLNDNDLHFICEKTNNVYYKKLIVPIYNKWKNDPTNLYYHDKQEFEKMTDTTFHNFQNLFSIVHGPIKATEKLLIFLNEKLKKINQDKKLIEKKEKIIKKKNEQKNIDTETIDITKKMSINEIVKYSKEVLKHALKSNNISGYSKMKKQEMVDKIFILCNNGPINDNNLSKYKKKNIPKKLKMEIWDKYIGKEKGIGECHVCKTEIDSKHFEAGHVEAESTGGETNISNLRPICGPCNKSMGNMNMDEYKLKYYGSEIKKEDDRCTKENKDIVKIIFMDPNKWIEGKERKSKLLDPSSELYKRLDDMLLKITKKYQGLLLPKRMDHHIELVSKHEKWSEDKLINRAKELSNVKITIKLVKVKDRLEIETPSVNSAVSFVGVATSSRKMSTLKMVGPRIHRLLRGSPLVSIFVYSRS